VTVLDEEFFKNHALRIRKLADEADPFIKKRLLQLAARYERPTPTHEPSRVSAGLSDFKGKMTAERDHF